MRRRKRSRGEADGDVDTLDTERVESKGEDDRRPMMMREAEQRRRRRRGIFATFPLGGTRRHSSPDFPWRPYFIQNYRRTTFS